MHPSLADDLRLRTRDAHARAERHPLQARLVRAELSPREHAAYLAQLHALWAPLDRALADLAAADPRVAAMWRDHHPHAARVAADLAALGVPDPRALPLTPAAAHLAAAIDHAARAHGPERLALLGVWYVLEGSANGGRFIAAALRRALGPAAPVLTFDPHADQQRDRWSAWRTALDAADFSPPERDAVLAAADRTFHVIYDIMEALPHVTPNTLPADPPHARR